MENGKIFFLDHTTRKTTWEDPRFSNPDIAGTEVQYSRDYKHKYERFTRDGLRSLNVRSGQKLDIKVRRDNLVDDSFSQLMKVEAGDRLRSKLWVEFVGEKGLDYGGLAREWFNLLTTELFNPYYGLFEYSALDNYTLQINPNSGLCVENHLAWFQFIGRVAGLAVFHRKLVSGFFIRPFYSMMLGRDINLDSMEAVDAEFHSSLVFIRDNDPECLELTFQMDTSVFGETVVTELVEKGGDVPVTEDNKMVYIDKVIQWRFVDRVMPQMESFLQGFHGVIPASMIRDARFDEGELELLLGGIGTINVKDWRDNTEYKGGYMGEDRVILWFWRLILSFGDERRSRLLQFVTGTSRVPVNGFSELHGSNGPKKFTIEKAGNPNSLPRAHTCFNRLDMPEYRTFAELKSKVVTAIEGCRGFEGVD